MAGFHEVQFPTDISYGSSGGPGYQTEIVVTDSGQEERIARWSQARRRYNLVYGIQSHDDLTAVQKFFLARQGSANGFRFYDWLDHSTAFDSIGASDATDEKMTRLSDGGVDGDASETQFQLVKRYESGAQTILRTLEKPIAATVQVSLDDIEQTQRAGTITTANGAGTTLIDSNATFQTWGVQVGLTVTNSTDGSTGVITSVDSETQLTLSGGLSGGTDDDFDASDAYTINAGWTVNSTTGVVTFDTAPGVGVLVKAGCEFDVPVRFGEGADQALRGRIDDFSSGTIGDIPLVEVLQSTPVDEEFYYGGGTRYAISNNISITQLQGRVHVIAADVGSLTVSLPDMTGEPAGGPHFYIMNKNGANSFTVVNSSGTSIVTLDVDEGAIFTYEDTNGDWYALKGTA